MGEWNHELFGCFDNLGLCLISWILPCYTVGKTAEAVGDDCLLCGAGYIFGGCIVGGIIREKIRNQKGIEGSLVGDILVHWCCPICAIVQDNMEVVPSGAAGQSIARV